MRGPKTNAAARQKKKDPASRGKTPRAPSRLRLKKAADARARDAASRAKDFVELSKSVAMPPFMKGKQYAGAAAVWKFYEPLLKARHFWASEYIAPFTAFCIYYDEFLAADREVKAKGWGVEGLSTSGGDRFWKNPAVDVRDYAFDAVKDLSSRFGFTPMDLHRLERESAAAGGGRLPGSGEQRAEDELPLKEKPAEDAPPGGPGLLASFDSAPPNRSKPN